MASVSVVHVRQDTMQSWLVFSVVPVTQDTMESWLVSVWYL